MKAFNVNEALEFLNHQVADNLLVPFFIQEGLVVWAMETWIFFVSQIGFYLWWLHRLQFGFNSLLVSCFLLFNYLFIFCFEVLNVQDLNCGREIWVGKFGF